MQEKSFRPSRQNNSQIHFVHRPMPFPVPLYWADLRFWIILHHDPLLTIIACQVVTFLCRAPTQVRLRGRTCTHFIRSPSTPCTILFSILDLKALFFNDLEWKGLAIRTFTGWVLMLLVEGARIRVRGGRAYEDRGEEFCKQRFTARKTTADDSDRGFDADNYEEDGAVPCKIGVG
jgi:hypothetical protein